MKASSNLASGCFGAWASIRVQEGVYQGFTRGLHGFYKGMIWVFGYEGLQKGLSRGCTGSS